MRAAQFLHTLARPIAERQGNAGRRAPAAGRAGRLFRRDAPGAAGHRFPQAVHHAFKARYAAVEARYTVFDMIFDTRHALAKVSQLPAEVSHPQAEVSRLPGKVLNVMAELPDVPTKPREQADRQPRQGDPDGRNRDEKGHPFPFPCRHRTRRAFAAQLRRSRPRRGAPSRRPDARGIRRSHGCPRSARRRRCRLPPARPAKNRRPAPFPSRARGTRTAPRR